MEERPGGTSKVILPDEIIDIGIDSLTVTVNAVDPDDQG